MTTPNYMPRLVPAPEAVTECTRVQLQLVHGSRRPPALAFTLTRASRDLPWSVSESHAGFGPDVARLLADWLAGPATAEVTGPMPTELMAELRAGLAAAASGEASEASPLPPRLAFGLSSTSEVSAVRQLLERGWEWERHSTFADGRVKVLLPGRGGFAVSEAVARVVTCPTLRELHALERKQLLGGLTRSPRWDRPKVVELLGPVTLRVQELLCGSSEVPR